jgi:hypothetical protein
MFGSQRRWETAQRSHRRADHPVACGLSSRHPTLGATSDDSGANIVFVCDPELLAEFRSIVHQIRAAAEDDQAIMMLAVGPLEPFFHQGHEEDLWPEVERLAREEPVFRRALRQCWAYESPMFVRRERLLEELGEE